MSSAATKAAAAVEVRMADPPKGFAGERESAILSQNRAETKNATAMMAAAGRVLWLTRSAKRCSVPHTVAFRHVAFEDLGLLAPLLAKRGHAVRYVDVPVADLDDFDPLAADLLVVLGGPIGVYE